MNAFVDFIERQPTGSIIMVAVADEAGLNVAQSCRSNGYAWTVRAYAALEALGARRIRNYCWRNSYSLIAVKGEGLKDEQLAGGGIQVTSRFARQDRWAISVTLNGSQFGPGQSMSVVATVVPQPPTSPLVDAYVVLRFPTGDFYSLQADGRLLPGVIPMARNFRPSAFLSRVHAFTFTGIEPAGTYVWYAALTHPGTLTLTSDLYQTSFTVHGAAN
jgi:hypothetical protein